jgi:hypothetical protein
MRLRRYLMGTRDAPTGDVQLPNESGKRDARLPSPSLRTLLSEGYAVLKAKELQGRKATDGKKVPPVKRALMQGRR